jgi:hypothetical protein
VGDIPPAVYRRPTIDSSILKEKSYYQVLREKPRQLLSQQQKRQLDIYNKVFPRYDQFPHHQSSTYYVPKSSSKSTTSLIKRKHPDASRDTVYALPSQTGNNEGFLTTNGTTSKDYCKFLMGEQLLRCPNTVYERSSDFCEYHNTKKTRNSLSPFCLSCRKNSRVREMCGRNSSKACLPCLKKKKWCHYYDPSKNINVLHIVKKSG